MAFKKQKHHWLSTITSISTLVVWASVLSNFTGQIANSQEPTNLAVKVEPDGVAVLIDGQLFAKYLKRSGTRPIVWPIIGPGGQQMTRGYPMAELGPSEASDHVHHRSLWFGYEGINGFNFWHEPEAGNRHSVTSGTIRHREIARADSDGQVATVVARNDYLGDSGQVVAQDERILRFGTDQLEADPFGPQAQTRWIDFQLRLWSEDRPLKLGDTKEGAFAIRVPGDMKVDAKKGGRILNSLGDTNHRAWGIPAEWVDYSGPVAGQNAGITIFTHPSGYNPKPCWHVRPYGLFAVNPFSKKAYNQPGEEGFEAAAGESVTIRYRVLFHNGKFDATQLAELFRRYAESH